MSFSGEVKAEISRGPASFKGKDKETRALIRDAFLKNGSMSDPRKSYHFEIVCDTRDEAEKLRDAINEFGEDAKIVERKGHPVVYLKEGEQIVTVLSVMGAYKALMELENIRIVKEMRGSVNRRVNCETANIRKTVDAAVRQVEAIRTIEETEGLDSLPKNLREIARVRLDNPEMPLQELGQMLDPPLGKSGVNHRLRKLIELAEKIGG